MVGNEVDTQAKLIRNMVYRVVPIAESLRTHVLNRTTELVGKTSSHIWDNVYVSVEHPGTRFTLIPKRKLKP